MVSILQAANLDTPLVQNSINLISKRFIHNSQLCVELLCLLMDKYRHTSTLEWERIYSKHDTLNYGKYF